MSTMVSRTICAKHSFKASVGRNVQFALDYVECPTCVAEVEREQEELRQKRWALEEMRAWLGHPSVCLCGVCAPGWAEEEAEFYQMLEEEAARLQVAEILSPNYCDHQTRSPMGFLGCTHSDCPHPGCLEEQAGDPWSQEPPF